MNRLKLTVLKKDEIDIVRRWREGKGYMLRTSYDVNEKMQEDWYNSVLSNRNSNFRFYAIRHESDLIGYGALEISWENGYAELGLLISPDHQKQGYGMESVDLLVNKAFKELRLNSLHYECYFCNPAVDFWVKVSQKYKSQTCIIPKRKYWNGSFTDSYYGVIENKSN